MKKYFFIIMIVASSCIAPPPEEKNNKVEIYPKGLFMIGNNLHYSNGNDIYCEFESWEEFDKLFDKSKIKRLIKYDTAPSGMALVKFCKKELIDEKKEEIFKIQ